jgi:iron(III) transport system ATP-binding protein
MNLLEGTVLRAADGALRFNVEGLGPIHLPGPDTVPLGRVGASFRPHAVDLQSAEAPRDRLHLWFDGVVAGSEFLGEFTRYRVRAGAGVIIADEAHYSGGARHPNGTPVALGIMPSQIRFFSE